MHAASRTRNTLALLAVLGLALTGCANSTTTGGSAEQPAPPAAAEPVKVDLTGSWKQSNSKSEDSYQAATITGDTIEINWVSDGGDTKSLYWAGTVTVPDSGSSFSWDSVNDTTKTDNALLASDAPAKTFTFENDEISYEASALGTTTVVRLVRG